MEDPNLNPGLSRKRTRTILIVVACLILVFVIMFVPAVTTAWAKMLRLDCQENLTQLGVKCREYASAHNGHFPSLWAELNFTGEDSNWVKVLRCPQTHQEVGAWSTVDLWSDYRLIPGRSTNDPPDTVLAIEPLANHDSAGANVLFVNGSTEWWPFSRVQGSTSQIK